MQEKKKPKRRLIWLRFLWVLIPLFLIGGFFILWNNDSTILDKKVSSEISSPTKDPAILKQAETEKVALLDDGTSIQQEVNNRNSTVSKIKDLNISVDNKVETEIQVDFKEKNIQYSVSTSIAQDNNENTPQIFNNQLNKTELIKTNVQKGELSSSVSDVINSNKSDNLNSNKKILTINSEMGPTILESLSKIAGVDVLLNYDLPVLDLRDEIELPEIDVMDVNKYDSYRTLSFLGGLGRGSKNLAFQKTSEDTTYVSARNNAEKLHSVWNGKVLLGFHKKGFIFNTGLTYRQHIESLKFNEQTTSEYVEEDTLSTLVDGQGNILSTQTGPVTFTTITDYDFQKRNRYHYIGIPLEIGRELSIGKWNMAVFGGSEINMVIKRSGAYLNTSNSFLDFSNPESELDYSRKVLFQLGLRSQISYEFKEGISLTVSPYASKYINSMTTAENQLSEKPLHYGIGIGLTYHFYKTH